MPCYLLHFSTPLKHARHYTGFSANLQSLMFRLAEHRAGVSKAAGRPVAIMKALHDAGISFELARVWPLASRSFERRLKRRSRRIRAVCPICSGEEALRLAKDPAEAQTEFQFKKARKPKAKKVKKQEGVDAAMVVVQLLPEGIFELRAGEPKLTQIG